jgi:hypothetical protein
MESFSGILDYKSFPEGIQSFRRTLDSIRRDFGWPDGVVSQPILICWDSLIYDRIFSTVLAHPSPLVAAHRSNYQALPTCANAVQIHTTLDLDQTDEAILQNLADCVAKGNGQQGATIFIVGGLMALRRTPRKSPLSGYGTTLARRFWQLLSAFASGLACRVIFLGAGVAPRDNPPNLQPHVGQFLEELARLDKANNSDETPISYCDIYTPGSFTEFKTVGSVLQESTDMAQRFIRDFVIIAGENMDPAFAYKPKV